MRNIITLLLLPFAIIGFILGIIILPAYAGYLIANDVLAELKQ